MQDYPKAVWGIPYVSVVFFPSLKQTFIAYRSSKVSDCIFEIHQLWQSGFSRVYSNYCSCSVEPKIIKTGQSSHKMYNNNIVNFQESTTILNARTKKSGNLLKAPRKSKKRQYNNRNKRRSKMKKKRKKRRKKIQSFNSKKSAQEFHFDCNRSTFDVTVFQNQSLLTEGYHVGYRTTIPYRFVSHYTRK